MFDEGIFDECNQENEDDTNIKLNEFQEAVIWGTDWTTGTIVNQMNKGNIDLDPKFQRREAWTKQRKSSFIESLILGLPIPQIILAERKDKKNTYLVIDGKQRLISIKQFFSDPHDSDFSQLKLTGLKSLKELNGLSFKNLSENPDLEEYAIAIENQSIRTIVIKNWPNEDFLYTVFLRLNTGSLPLAPQELRQALHPGKFIDFVDEFSIESSAIKKVLNIKNPDYRMRDVELVVRYFAFKYFIESYTGNLKKFFDKTVENLNQAWENESEEIQESAQQLQSAIDFSYAIFERDAFRKWKNRSYEGRFNRAIFDIMVFYFSDPVTRDMSRSHFDEIKKSFQDLCEESDHEFLNSFETSTKNIKPTRVRFQRWGQELQRVINHQLYIPEMSGTLD